jgi:hypothetical protein
VTERELGLAICSLSLLPPTLAASPKVLEINAEPPYSRFERHNFFLSFLATNPFPREILNRTLTYVNPSSSLEARSDCFHSNPVPLLKSINTILLTYF